MELFILLPIILVMTGVAVAMALNEHPLPQGASSAFNSSALRTPPGRTGPEDSTAKAADLASIVLPDEPRQPSISTKETENVTDSNFSQTDVLLADALTEMIGLKAELYHLRSKLDSLNFEVARLSGGPPRTPPAASKRPVQLRRAA